MTAHSPFPALCVDLDGTLIHGDLLLESFLLLIRRNPLYLLLIPVWLWRGKAALKAEIAKRVVLDPACLPYNKPFLAWLAEQKNSGHPLWLCTASNHRLAEQVAAHLGIFAGVLASSDTENLSGSRKARGLVEKFGERGFDYCGNERIDLAVWKNCRGAVVVNGNARLEAAAGAAAELRAAFPRRGRGLLAALKALRPHQWAKNLLLFVPLAASHQLGNTGLLAAAGVAFLAFGLAASSAYVLNDMMDLGADRLHPRKRRRPFAAGDLSLLAGFALVPGLLAGALFLAVWLPSGFWLALGVYLALTLAYSFVLKRMVLVDALALAGLYTIRIVAGGEAIGVPPSFWLLSFSIFLFLSLALVKRYTELEAMRRQGRLKAKGRGYHVEDLPILHSLGAAAGYLCVLVLALYINNETVETLYSHPKVIWFLCVLLLYWISYIWIKTHRGEMHDDPVVFALKDGHSLSVGVLAAITILLAI